MLTTLGSGHELKRIATDALGKAINLACANILNRNVPDAIDCTLSALAAMVAVQVKESAATEEVVSDYAQVFAETLRKALQAHRLEGPFSAESLAALKTLYIGLPISARLLKSLGDAGLINPDGTVSAETLATVEALHKGR